MQLESSIRTCYRCGHAVAEREARQVEVFKIASKKEIRYYSRDCAPAWDIEVRGYWPELNGRWKVVGAVGDTEPMALCTKVEDV